MSQAEEVLAGLRDGRLCTVCRRREPVDWSLDECHACIHIVSSGLSITRLSASCGQCRDAWYRAEMDREMANILPATALRP